MPIAAGERRTNTLALGRSFPMSARRTRAVRCSRLPLPALSYHLLPLCALGTRVPNLPPPTLENSGVPYRCQYSGAGYPWLVPPGSEQHEEPMSDMRRREFITLFAGAAAAWPFAARAEQPTKPVIGLISAGTPESGAYGMTVFRQGLNEGRYAEGQSVAMEYRWAEARYELMPGLVADLLHRRVAIIATPGSTDAALAAKAATAAVSIVFADEVDPVKLGLVKSVVQPGGNVTGVTAPPGIELQENRIRLLRELVPTVNSIAVLLNPARPVFDAQSK